MVFRKCLQILEWIREFNAKEPEIFVETVNFSDLEAHWDEVNMKLGVGFNGMKRIEIIAEDVSYTRRRRVYFTNFPVPEKWSEMTNGFFPMEPNECMDEGRKLWKYQKEGRWHVQYSS